MRGVGGGVTLGIVKLAEADNERYVRELEESATTAMWIMLR